MFRWLPIFLKRRFLRAENTSPSIAESIDPHRRIAHVRIEEGCVVCGSCEVICPKIFVLEEGSSALRENAHLHFAAQHEAIEAAALGCCVEVIKIEYR
jgi:ferredoxin